ncbi:hypothetical protein [Telluribacter sp. SYSU D00476]|uniref:hypothetical protein n=1 Tax=Telluribacter sp. SYSU D00476 TaxID=2811430 RepID=UPI001FF61C0B|nr:hypothetical protein [Telluribacter sp. SYSU D00476]
MVRRRGEPAIPGVEKEAFEAPVFTSYPTNTVPTTPPAEDPSINHSSRDNEDNDEENTTDEKE